MSSISSIHTPCKDCIFAAYNGLTQTDCNLDYLSKYKNKHCEILEVYDNEKEFYVINDKKCLGYRDNRWIKKHNLEHSGIEDKIKKFKETNRLQYIMMIDLKNFNKIKLNKLNAQIQQCSIQPEKIIFIRYQNDINDFTYENITQFLSSAKINCKWRIQTMVDGELKHEDILHNCCNLNKGYRFFVSIKDYSDDLSKIIETANNIVYDQLDSLTVICDKNNDIILFSAPSYRWSIVVEKKNILDDKTNYIVI
jgi:hypothetical protein